MANWLWSFGDSATATTGAGVTHTYLAPGTYNVNLTVSNGAGSYIVSRPHLILVDPRKLFLPLIQR